MAKDKSSSQDEQEATPQTNTVLYARFALPVQFIGVSGGVHNDTAHMGKDVKLSLTPAGLKIRTTGRTFLVGFPNLVYLEMANGN